MKREAVWPRESAGHNTKLRQARLKKKIPLRKVAADLGISDPYLSQLERGLHEVGLAKGLRLAKYFGLKPEELLEEVEE